MTRSVGGLRTRRAAVGQSEEAVVEPEARGLPAVDLPPLNLSIVRRRTLSLRLPDMSGRSAVAAVLIVMLGLGALDAVLVRTNLRTDAAETARIEATAAAKTAVPQMLSYDHKTLEKDLATAKRQVTGSFHDEFAVLLTKVVGPAAKAQRTSVKTVLNGTSVVGAKPNQVVLLVFLNQEATSTTSRAPQIQGSRVRVTMTKTGSKWLVSALTTV